MNKQQTTHNVDYSLNASSFLINGVIYTIIGTSFGLRGVEYAVDTIQNTKTGNKKELARKSLVNLLKKNNAVCFLGF